MSVSTVAEMKKVELLLTKFDENRVEGKAVPFSFVLGIESGGLTPFEQELCGKSVGERIRLQPETTELPSFFGSCYLPVCQALSCSAFEPLLLSIEIVAVREPDNREVVAQLARSTGHGGCGGGSCGCGCG